MRIKSAKRFMISLVLIMGLGIGGYVGFSALYDRFQLDTVKLDFDTIVSDDLENTDDTISGSKYIKVALLGTDSSGLRTDSMMVMVFNKKTGVLDLFGVPRDTYIEVSSQVKDQLKEVIHLPSYMKLTDFYSYMKRAKVESPESYTVKAIEQLMGIDIDHVVLLNTSGFREVVDSVGGVEVDVPRNLDYDDPYQNLHIHLNKGLQVLNGDKAEQFVRFRQTNNHTGYGDFGRMEMQQYFLKSFLKTLSKPENFKNMNNIITAMSQFVSTDVDMIKALSYVPYLNDVKYDSIQSHMLPGDAATINEGWYFKLKPNDELHAFVSESLEQSSMSIKDSKGLNIVVKNGSGKSGVAKNISSELQLEGYTISDIGNYGVDRTQKTRIIVKNSGDGLDLLKYFNLAEIEVSPDEVTQDSDIIIIVGGADA